MKLQDRINMSCRNLAAGARALAPLLLTLAVAAPVAAAAAQPAAGPVFSLSSCSDCVQNDPVVAGNAGGGFLAAWDALTDVVQQDVFGRIFGASDAPLGGDFALPEPTGSQPPQTAAAAVADTQGRYVVVWTSQAGDQSTVLAQRYAPRGRPVGGTIVVASDPSGSPATPADSRPAVAATPDGGFVVAWIALPTGAQASGPPRVMARLFDAAGAAAGAEIQLSTGLALTDRPSLCVSGSGRIHAAWTFANSLQPFEPNLAGVAVRRLTPAGVAIGDEQVVAPALASESSVAISCGPGNTYMVAWQTDQAPAVAGTDIVAQRFTRLGRAIGTPQLVNQVTDQQQSHPALFHDPTGAYVVVWEGTPGGVNGVRGRRFSDSTGGALTDEFVVYRGSPGDLTTLRPAITGVGVDGAFVVALSAPGGVFGRAFAATPAAAMADMADVGGAAGADSRAVAAAGGIALGGDGQRGQGDAAGATGNGSSATGLWR